VPAASAVVVNDDGAILLQRRRDNDLWSIPGGAMEAGESIAETVVREVKEETGLDVRPEKITGIYSDPDHVIEYGDGEVRQEFSICFACRVEGGQLAVSDESTEVGFFKPQELEALPMHDSIRLRIRHYLEHRPAPVIA
jgi:8-oxo-dGTP pyrophosphatase MutT (NUDIX family)